MTNEELLSEFSSILGKLLANESITLRMETKRADVQDWDSFQYVNFIVAVELRLNVKFRVADVEAFETVGDIVTETQALLAKAT